jgi:lipopolysaccharide transport system permease protein
MLKSLPPDFEALYPGLVLTLVILPISYVFFKRAENWFADVI